MGIGGVNVPLEEKSRDAQVASYTGIYDTEGVPHTKSGERQPIQVNMQVCGFPGLAWEARGGQQQVDSQRGSCGGEIFQGKARAQLMPSSLLYISKTAGQSIVGKHQPCFPSRSQRSSKGQKVVGGFLDACKAFWGAAAEGHVS